MWSFTVCSWQIIVFHLAKRIIWLHPIVEWLRVLTWIICSPMVVCLSPAWIAQGMLSVACRGLFMGLLLMLQFPHLMDWHGTKRRIWSWKTTKLKAKKDFCKLVNEHSVIPSSHHLQQELWLSSLVYPSILGCPGGRLLDVSPVNRSESGWILKMQGISVSLSVLTLTLWTQHWQVWHSSQQISFCCCKQLNHPFPGRGS